MERCAIVIGNGLGMAMDSRYFSLSTGLSAIWAGTSSFDENQKQLVISAIPGLSSTSPPQSEDQLDTLQVAIVAADFLRSFESTTVKWLSDGSRQLPQAFRRFVHEVGVYFYSSRRVLPERFVASLAKFVSDTKSHVATLNYDNLLYDAFVQAEVLNGYNGVLLDGFRRNGFDKKNLHRRFVSRHGWYLHLHGSPLYIGNKKLMGDDRRQLKPTDKSHIVLSHVKHKPLIIESSGILSEYWSTFEAALCESHKVILFGYSGCDIHLNETLCSRCRQKPIHVIEWRAGMNGTVRQQYWHDQLKNCPVVLHQMDSILDFDAWRNL